MNTTALPLITNAESNAMDVVIVVIGILSAVGSFLVVLTIVLNPSMVRRKIFVHTICMMSLCDAIGNVAFSIGIRREGTLCSFQGGVHFLSLSLLHTHTLALSLSLTHSHTLSHTHTRSLFLSIYFFHSYTHTHPVSISCLHTTLSFFVRFYHQG